MSTHYLTSPVPIEVVRHPNVDDRWTHLIRQRDANARGWHFFGNIPFGVWRTRAAARAYARKLQARGVVVIRETRV